jgi:hypothetical protein
MGASLNGETAKIDDLTNQNLLCIFRKNLCSQMRSIAAS